MLGVRVAIQGFGEIGRLLAKTCLKRGYELVGVIDVKEELVGRDAGVLIGVGERGLRVNRSLGDVLREGRPDILIQSTTSRLDEAYPQFKHALEHGVDVISTCETLVYPHYRYRELAGEIDRAARRGGAAVIGAGINPGYLLDLLPAFLTAPCASVESVKAVRQLDAAKRREAFRRKIGIGMRPAEFRDLLARGVLTGHVGMAESALLLARMLGMKVDEVVEEQEPIVADEVAESAGTRVSPGQVKGVDSTCIVRSSGTDIVTLRFSAYVAAREYEEIIVRGEPDVRWLSSGTPGDIATAAYIVNLIPQVAEAGPGLLLLDELRTPHYSRVPLGGVRGP